jgi:hypothetical protein
MSERVSIIRGKKPIIFIAPHGADDPHTAIVAQDAAKESGGCAIINRGFKRSTTVNVIKDRASCHRIDHITQPVVEDEFLIPLKKLIDKFASSFDNIINSKFYWTDDVKERVSIFYIYSCPDLVNQLTKDSVGIILGYGQGKARNSLTIPKWKKELFSKLYDEYDHGKVYDGKPGGQFAGRGSNNVVQYFRMFENDPLVETMQIAIPESVISTKASSMVTGLLLGATAKDMKKTPKEDKSFKSIPRFI